MTVPYGGPAIGKLPVTGVLPTGDSPTTPTLLYQFSIAGATADQIGPDVSTAGYRYLLFVCNLTAISAGSVAFILRANGAYGHVTLFTVTETTVIEVVESVGPGMQTPTVLLPDVSFVANIVTGPATFTVEIWGWA